MAVDGLVAACAIVVVVMLVLYATSPDRVTGARLRAGLSDVWAVIAVAVAGIGALIFDESLALVAGGLFIALRRELVRVAQDHRRLVWRMEPAELSARMTEIVVVLFGLVCVGVGLLTLAARLRAG